MARVGDLDYLNGSVVCMTYTYTKWPYTKCEIPMPTLTDKGGFGEHTQIKRYKVANRGKWGQQQSASRGLFQGNSTQAQTKTTKNVERPVLAVKLGLHSAHV